MNGVDTSRSPTPTNHFSQICFCEYLVPNFFEFVCSYSQYLLIIGMKKKIVKSIIFHVSVCVF